MWGLLILSLIINIVLVLYMFPQTHKVFFEKKNLVEVPVGYDDEPNILKLKDANKNYGDYEEVFDRNKGWRNLIG